MKDPNGVLSMIIKKKKCGLNSLLLIYIYFINVAAVAMTCVLFKLMKNYKELQTN